MTGLPVTVMGATPPMPDMGDAGCPPYDLRYCRQVLKPNQMVVKQQYDWMGGMNKTGSKTQQSAWEANRVVGPWCHWPRVPKNVCFDFLKQGACGNPYCKFQHYVMVYPTEEEAPALFAQLTNDDPYPTVLLHVMFGSINTQIPADVLSAQVTAKKEQQQKTWLSKQHRAENAIVKETRDVSTRELSFAKKALTDSTADHDDPLDAAKAMEIGLQVFLARSKERQLSSELDTSNNVLRSNMVVGLTAAGIKGKLPGVAEELPLKRMRLEETQKKGQ